MRLISRIVCHRRDAIDTEPEASPKRLRPPLTSPWNDLPTTEGPHEHGLTLVSSDGEHFPVSWSILESAR
jgi:hypothetical protein